jgi:hypothetical protein
MERVPLLSTKAETKIITIIARKMMVATTRTGLNIWIGERVKERSNHPQESAHEFRLLDKLFARKKKVRIERKGQIGVQKLRAYPNQKSCAYERNDGPKTIEDYDIGVRSKPQDYVCWPYKGKCTCEGTQTTDEKHHRAEYAQDQSNGETVEAELDVIRKGGHDADSRPGPTLSN